MPDRILRTQTDVDALATFFKGQKLPLTVNWQKGKHRSTEQNRLQWLWAGEIAQQAGDRETADVQAEFKLEIGVPIMRENDDFREKYDRIIRPLPYEDKITIMRDFDFPVSSLMKTPQMVRFLDAIQARYEARGFELTDPDPDMAKYMDRYREKAA